MCKLCEKNQNTHEVDRSNLEQMGWRSILLDRKI